MAISEGEAATSSFDMSRFRRALEITQPVAVPKSGKDKTELLEWT
jgi:hypothetical protein